MNLFLTKRLGGTLFLAPFVYYVFADINECQDQEPRCHENAQCENTVGSFYCFCPQGYSGDGANCLGMNHQS